jgi:hypothetical protein
MTTTCTSEAIVAALVYGVELPQPRACGVRLAVDNRVSWDAGEEVHIPKRSRAKGGPRDVQTPHLRERKADRLLDIMAKANCDAANACGLADLVAVVWCIANAPFPLGGGAEIFHAARTRIEQAFLHRAEASLHGVVYDPAPKTLEGWLLGFSDTTLGQLRQWLVTRAGEGCNAPTDSYLRLAAWFAAHPGATSDDVPSDYNN